MSQSQDNFDDPMLKQALRRAVPRTMAPDSLRNHVIEMMGHDQPPLRLEYERPTPWYRRLVHGTHAARNLAVAASVAGLLLGGGIFFVASTPSPVTPPQVMVAPFMQNAIFHHQQTEQSIEDGQNVLMPSDQIAREEPVHPHLDLSSFGWRLLGARKHGEDAAATFEFVYQRGGQRLSLLVIPNDAPPPNGITVTNSHIIVMRHMPHASVCVVTSQENETAREMEHIADVVTGQ